MSGNPNHFLFTVPPPGYKKPTTSVRQRPSNPPLTTDKSPTNRYLYPFSVNPSVPPPPPPSSSPNKTPYPQKNTYTSKFASYDSTSINIQNLNKNSSFLNYHQEIGNNADKKYPNNQSYPQNNPNTPKCNTTTAVTYSTTQTGLAKPLPSPVSQYPLGYRPQALPYSGGISYPPPPLPAPAPPVAFTPTLPPPPPTIQYSLNPAAYFVPAPANNSQIPAHVVVSSPYQQQQQNNAYFQKGFNNLKRKRIASGEEQTNQRVHKRKKRPLSQAIPLKKEWSVEDAIRALKVEKESNKLLKSPSLIIKFPDLELNREIVQKFNTKIESVHFQQPSTARYCFVSLHKDADMQQVIQELNQTKFGDGFLSAEHKKDRDESENIGPEDIDPLTLYVGNLSQEVTIEDVHKAFPKLKRVDIGFAKKMRYTRYAFVCFKNADDAIEAFQNTHATEMHNKSIIVRFRRLHGTVGLPGEVKQQNTRKNELDTSTSANTVSRGDLEIDVTAEETSISLNDSVEDEEVDHRRAMQRYIDRVKEENPEMEENDDWVYSEEEENYDPIPDWLNRASDSHRLTNQKAETPKLSNERQCRTQKEQTERSPMPNQTLAHIPKIEVKFEPSDDYSSSSVTDINCQNVSVKAEPAELSNYYGFGSSRLQPIIEQAHRPMIEPKLELTESSRNSEHSRNREMLNDSDGTVLNQPPRNPPAWETSRNRGLPNDSSFTFLNQPPPFKPMLEPKLESTETPRNSDLSLSRNRDLLNDSSFTFLNHPPPFKPMLEPKLESTLPPRSPHVSEPSRNPDLSSDRSSTVTNQPSVNPSLPEPPKNPALSNIRGCILPKQSSRDPDLSNDMIPLPNQPLTSPYLSEPPKNPALSTDRDHTPPNQPSTSPHLSETSKNPELSNNKGSISPNKPYRDSEPFGNGDLLNDRSDSLLNQPPGIPCTLKPSRNSDLSNNSGSSSEQSKIEELLHRPMVEPKLEPPDLLQSKEHDINVMSKDNTLETNHTEEVQTVKVKQEKINDFNNQKVQNNDSVSSIETNKNERCLDISNKDKDENNLVDTNRHSIDKEQTKIKKEIVENAADENKTQDDDANDSSEDEENSYDLNNFLTNIKTRKSFL